MTKNIKSNFSSIIEKMQNYIPKNDFASNFENTPITKSLRGSFKAPQNFDYKNELTESLTNKYLINS